MGIADSVTVLARDGAMADAAATVVGNAVDLPGHGGVVRRAACEIDPASDLGGRLVTWDVGVLGEGEVMAALGRGLAVAEELRERGLIEGAVLGLRGRFLTCFQPMVRAA